MAGNKHIARIKAKNKEAGYHFFDDETMTFFRSGIASGLLHDRFFITSETNPSGDCRYTIREALDNGHIKTVGEFHDFDTLADAKKALKYYLNNKIYGKKTIKYTGKKTL